jgi:uncharacterized protein (TIGR03437 family)
MSNTFVAGVQATLPAILGIVHQSDGAVVGNADPAVAGETLVVYMAGLGAANASLSFGEAAPANPPAATAVTPQAALGTTPVNVVFSELSPGFVGLYQVAVVMPATLPQGGSANLTVTAGSPSAPTASAPIALATQ